MKVLVCDVMDQDPLSRELLVDFIEKTEGLSLRSDKETPLDLIFIDEDLDGSVISLQEKRFQMVIISANAKYVYWLFKKKVADYMYKPDLTYKRFLDAIDKVRKRALKGWK